jgi:hypothetical protein
LRASQGRCGSPAFAEFCSWPGLCPGSKISGGKLLSSGTSEAFVDQGQQRYEEQQRERSVAALKRRAASRDFSLTPAAAPAHASAG